MEEIDKIKRAMACVFKARRSALTAGAPPTAVGRLALQSG
jgi:hypothetical protein